jgi:hypothetical protein
MTLDYAEAVTLADTALMAILDPLKRPESTWGFEDRNTAAIAFGDWLYEHPEVSEVLQAAAEFEPFMLEDYIDLHSVAYEATLNEDAIGEPLDPGSWFTGDGVLIRKRAGNW